MPSREPYSEAIDILEAAMAPLDHPSKGIGYSPGLRRGEIGHAIAVEARDKLRHLRDSFVRYQEQED